MYVCIYIYICIYIYMSLSLSIYMYICRNLVDLGGLAHEAADAGDLGAAPEKRYIQISIKHN